MPEIKIKHLVSFSSEDKVHKAENILKNETYRKWKCATPGEKNASICLQFEKATQIFSIDIGNESSAFVEVLVGRSSDSVKDFKEYLVASSFMSPLESRNETNNNRVRMFGQDKLVQNLKDEKWDCVQVLCTQPFNKNITYGLSFIKFHSPPESNEEENHKKETNKAVTKLGAFNIKYDDDEEEENSSQKFSSWREHKNKKIAENIKSVEEVPKSYAASVLASSNSSPKLSVKRKQDSAGLSCTPPLKKDSRTKVNVEKVGYKDILGLYGSDDEGSPKQLPKDKEQLNIINNSKKKYNTENKSPAASAKQTQRRDEETFNTRRKGKDEKKIPFHKIMDKVVFTLSGFVNPLRSEIRDKALEMGAKYKGDWDGACTHLVCAFINTPKYQQVQKKDGKIVSKEWILDCYRKKFQLPWKKYALGTYFANTSSEESDDESIAVVPPAKKKNTENGFKQNNTASTSSKSPRISSKVNDLSESETEDEDAVEDYIADTDVESGSGGDTEDEIRKVEKQSKAGKKLQFNSEDEDDDDCSLLPSRPDTKDLPLPALPSIFKKRHFFLYGDFSTKKHHDLQRYITAYDGILEDYMSESVKYVITESKWDKNFEEALSENEDLIFVKPEWIFKCDEAQKLIPYQPFIIIPNL